MATVCLFLDATKHPKITTLWTKVEASCGSTACSQNIWEAEAGGFRI